MRWHIHFLTAAEKEIDARHLSLGQCPVEQAVLPPNSKAANALTTDVLLKVSKVYEAKRKALQDNMYLLHLPSTYVFKLQLPVKTNLHTIKGTACSKMSTQRPDLKPYFYFCSDFPGYKRQIPFPPHLLKIAFVSCFFLKKQEKFLYFIIKFIPILDLFNANDTMQ